jgi:3D (Asp-Asp-Asp) domain-containing protein
MSFYKIPYTFAIILMLSFIPINVSGGAKLVLKVTATAYNSLPSQTDSTPNIAAWGDKLVPGMKVIAVSHDLLSMGLSHGSKVKIAGMSGTYTVLDKMNPRWQRKIDIYMGNNIKAAKKWGKRQVYIQW